MFDNQIIHTEHRDVIHDCAYDYYGQVSYALKALKFKNHGIFLKLQFSEDSKIFN